jgi:hypothetical protein
LTCESPVLINYQARWGSNARSTYSRTALVNRRRAYWSILTLSESLRRILAGMLVNYPLMVVQRRSNSFSSAGAGIMRQPSADDLDAAQQLVESARGDRQGIIAAAAQHDQPYAEPDSTKTPSISPAAENGQVDAPMMEEANGLGQACRYVHAP